MILLWNGKEKVFVKHDTEGFKMIIVITLQNISIATLVNVLFNVVIINGEYGIYIMENSVASIQTEYQKIDIFCQFSMTNNVLDKLNE